MFETGDNPHDERHRRFGSQGFWKKVYDSSKTLGYSYVIYFNAIGTTGDHRMLPGTAFGDRTAALLRSRMSPQ